VSPNEDPEFRSRMEDAQSELLTKFRTDLCHHGHRKWDDRGRRLTCPQCTAEAATKVANPPVEQG
jgi:hypothetical protein